MCFICGKNDGINGNELICDKCYIESKKLPDLFNKKSYHKEIRNRYR